MASGIGRAEAPCLVTQFAAVRVLVVLWAIAHDQHRLKTERGLDTDLAAVPDLWQSVTAALAAAAGRRGCLGASGRERGAVGRLERARGKGVSRDGRKSRRRKLPSARASRPGAWRGFGRPRGNVLAVEDQSGTVS